MVIGGEFNRGVDAGNEGVMGRFGIQDRIIGIEGGSELRLQPLGG